MAGLSDTLEFLSHLGDGQELRSAYRSTQTFLSHLGDGQEYKNGDTVFQNFLSHLGDGQEELYLKKLSYTKA